MYFNTIKTIRYYKKNPRDTDITIKENCAICTISLFYAEIINKILTNRIQQFVKRIMHHGNKVGFISVCKNDLIFERHTM